MTTDDGLLERLARLEQEVRALRAELKGSQSSAGWLAVVLTVILLPQLVATHPVQPASPSSGIDRQLLDIQCVNGHRYHITAPASEPVEIILRALGKQNGSECSVVP